MDLRGAAGLGRAGEGPAVGAGRPLEDLDLLRKEADQAPLRVPRGLESLAPELQRASARIRAAGHPDPFREEVLKATAPSALRAALERAHAKGLLEEGPAWARQGERLGEVADALRKALGPQREPERALDRLQGRGL